MNFPFFLATKYLKPDRSCSTIVTSIAVLGVVLGVAILIIVRSVMTGFGDMWREKILAFKPHLTITSVEGVIHSDGELAESLRKIPGVEAASPSIEVRVLAEHDHRVNAPVVIGIDPEGLMALHPGLVESIHSGELSFEENGVLLGQDLAASLGVYVGDNVLVYSPMNLISDEEMYFPEEVRVAGIFEMGQAEFDGNYIIASIGFVRDILGLARGGAYSIHVKTRDPQTPLVFEEIVDSVRGMLGPSYLVRTWQEVDRDLFAAIAVEKNMMVLLLMFITIVAIFCVANTIIVITVRKTGEIGLLKALGFSSGRVMAAFVLYGLIQCFVGMVLGVGLAFLVLHNMQGIVDALADFGLNVFPKNVYGLDRIPWRVIPREIVETVLFVVVSCVVASIIPAWRAAVKKPAEALRQ